MPRALGTDDRKRVDSVFIFRPDNLGDLVLFSGELRHIRSLYREAKIALFVKRSFSNLFALCPYIDELLEWEKLSSLPFPWFPDVRGKYRLNWEIRKLLNKRYKTNIILLPVRSPTVDSFGMHNVVASISASEKMGIAGDYCNQSEKDDRAADKIYSNRLRLRTEQQKTNELEINREFIRFLGVTVSTEDICPEFWTNEKDRAWAHHYIPKNKQVVTLAICPGVTSHPGKFYPGTKYAQAIMQLKDIKFSPVLFGSPREQSMCEEVAGALAQCDNVENITDLSGKSTIRQLIEGIRRCDLLMSQETGALQIGVALRKPTVGILGGGHFGRFYPWGNERINRVVNKQMDCYCCNWKCIYSTTRCIQEIEPRVIAEQLRLALIEGNLI